MPYLSQKMMNTEAPIAAGIAPSSSVKCSVGLAVVPLILYTNSTASDMVKNQTHSMSSFLHLEFGGAAWNFLTLKKRLTMVKYAEATNEMAPASPQEW